MAKQFEDVSAARGAPMGREEWREEPVQGAVRLFRVRLIDGDYDDGGAYWGSGEPLYCATDDVGYRRFVRASSEYKALEALDLTPNMLVQVRIQGLEDFVASYTAAALWSSSDTNDEGKDVALDNFDLADSALESMTEDCKDFMITHKDLLAEYVAAGQTLDQAGHDFWLTRCDHGAGFWDRGLGELGTKLSEAAKAFGSVDLYLGDDGLVHC